MLRLAAALLRSPAAASWQQSSWAIGLAQAQLQQLSTCSTAGPAAIIAAAALAQRACEAGGQYGMQCLHSGAPPAAQLHDLLLHSNARAYHASNTQAAISDSSSSPGQSPSSQAPTATQRASSQVPQQSPLQVQPLADAEDEDDVWYQRYQKHRAPRPKPTEGVCTRKNLRVGWKKLDWVTKLVRRLHVDDAIAQLDMCAKRAALPVRSSVINARVNAINIGLDPELLVVDRIFVSKGSNYFKRRWFHGMGYMSIRESQRTHLTVVVKEDPDVRHRQQAPPRHGVPTRMVAPFMARPRKERQHPRPPPLHALRAQQSGSAAWGSS